MPTMAPKPEMHVHTGGLPPDYATAPCGGLQVDGMYAALHAAEHAKKAAEEAAAARTLQGTIAQQHMQKGAKSTSLEAVGNRQQK